MRNHFLGSSCDSVKMFIYVEIDSVSPYIGACLKHAGTVLQAETPGQWRRCTKADRRPMSNYQGTCQHLRRLTVIME